MKGIITKTKLMIAEFDVNNLIGVTIQHNLNAWKIDEIIFPERKEREKRFELWATSSTGQTLFLKLNKINLIRYYKIFSK